MHSKFTSDFLSILFSDVHIQAIVVYYPNRVILYSVTNQ